MGLDLNLSLSRKSYDDQDNYSAKKKVLMSSSMSSIQRNNILDARARTSIDEFLMKKKELHRQLLIKSSPIELFRPIMPKEQQPPSTGLRLGGRDMVIFNQRAPPKEEDTNNLTNNGEAASPNILHCSKSGRNSSKKRSAPEALDDDDGEQVLLLTNGGERKKLRLTEEQSVVLEQTFMRQSTVDNKKKLELAEQLSLKPRQVEVWFQNRRARTKLKQTEVHYEHLKKYSAELMKENQNLNKEVQQLRRILLAPERVCLAGSTTISFLCPSCDQRLSTSDLPASSSLLALTNVSSSTTESPLPVVSVPAISRTDII